jgi:cytoskeletal protein CcmA (bactofilin family)
MTTNELRLAEANVAYIGKGVTIKGEINAPDVIVVDGTIKGTSPRALSGSAPQA